jgi:hypothetical protein
MMQEEHKKGVWTCGELLSQVTGSYICKMFFKMTQETYMMQSMLYRLR